MKYLSKNITIMGNSSKRKNIKKKSKHTKGKHYPRGSLLANCDACRKGSGICFNRGKKKHLPNIIDSLISSVDMSEYLSSDIVIPSNVDIPSTDVDPFEFIRPEPLNIIKVSISDEFDENMELNDNDKVCISKIFETNKDLQELSFLEKDQHFSCWKNDSLFNPQSSIYLK